LPAHPVLLPRRLRPRRPLEAGPQPTTGRPQDDGTAAAEDTELSLPCTALEVRYLFRYHRGVDTVALIREARERAGLTIRQLAKRAGTSHSAIAAYESGAKAPNTATLDRIVQACGFGLTNQLVPRAPFEDRAARGREILRVLELAEEFPTEHQRAIAGKFGVR